MLYRRVYAITHCRFAQILHLDDLFSLITDAVFTVCIAWCLSTLLPVVQGLTDAG